jgi:small subunit ribosomal protein S14
MNYQVFKDQKKRILVQREAARRLKHKAVIREENHSGRRWFQIFQLSKRPQRGSLKGVKNRCVLTGRGKSIHRAFKLSRIALRELGSEGRINGLRKSSW